VKKSSGTVIPSEARNLALLFWFVFARSRARFLASLGMTWALVLYSITDSNPFTPSHAEGHIMPALRAYPRGEPAKGRLSNVRVAHTLLFMYAP
jgi:hypothetical protein